MTNQELLAAIESAAGPSRELDLRIKAALFGFRVEDRGAGGMFLWDDREGAPACADDLHSVVPYTASLDLCAYLQQRLLPGWYRRTVHGPATGFCVDLSRTAPPRIETGWHETSETLAWLAAILRAVNSEDA